MRSHEICALYMLQSKTVLGKFCFMLFSCLSVTGGSDIKLCNIFVENYYKPWDFEYKPEFLDTFINYFESEKGSLLAKCVKQFTFSIEVLGVVVWILVASRGYLEGILSSFTFMVILLEEWLITTHWIAPFIYGSAYLHFSVIVIK